MMTIIKVVLMIGIIVITSKSVIVMKNVFFLN